MQRRAAGTGYVENLLEGELATAPLSAPDRGLCRELVYGLTRWQATLDWLIARKTEGRAQKAVLQILLRLGLYQLFWLDRIPPHAAVHETVELARQLGCGPQAGFVNALLRGYDRERAATRKLLDELKTTQPHLGWSHPEWLVVRWQNRWGADPTAKLLEWNNTPPTTFARLNTLRADATQLIERWRAETVDYDFRAWDWTGENLVFALKSHPPLAGLGSFQDGWFYVQDPGTLLAVRLLDPQPGETVLDLCAAPGGKTTFIAQLLQNRGRIVAQDNSSQRLKRIQENCERLGVACVEVCSSRREEAHSNADRAKRNSEKSQSLLTSAATIPHSALHTPHFDKVLLDAPCSNTGVMRRRVDLRWRIRPEEIERLRCAQLKLLRQAAAQLKPGGALVYSTCSLEPEENRGVVEQFLGEHADFKCETERELLPFVEGVDGAYVARLRRTA